MIVIGLTGRIGAGKSAVADHLVAEYGYTKLSFAGPLKKMLRTLNPIVDNPEGYVAVTLDEVFTGYGNDEAKVKASMYGAEYRRLMQVLGTDCIRALDENFWVRAAVAQLTDPNGKYVFDDVRFPNEANAVTIRDTMADAIWNESEPTDRAFLWRVVRPDYDNGASDHESEVHADTMPVDEILMNDSTIADLKDLVNNQVGEK